MTDLVSVRQFRVQTQNLYAEAADVRAALVLAVDAIEAEIGRALAYGEQTEHLTMVGDARVFPSRTPLAAGTPGRISDAEIRLTNYSIPWLTYSRLDGVEVTYQGGWTAETLPSKLRAAIIATAATAFIPREPGVDSGVSIPDSARQQIRAYRRRVVVPS